MKNTKLFDKRNSFAFTIIGMPYLNCSIVYFYSVFGAELLRSAATTHETIVFQINSTILINQMIKRGHKIGRLSTTLNKLFDSHFGVFQK